MQCLCQASESDLIEMIQSEAEPCGDAADNLMESVREISEKERWEEDDLDAIVMNAEELIGWAQHVLHAVNALQSRLSLV